MSMLMPQQFMPFKQTLVHPSLTHEDIAQLLSLCPSSKEKVLILGEIFVVPTVVFQKLSKQFDEEYQKALQTSNLSASQSKVGLLFSRPNPGKQALTLSSSSLRSSISDRKVRQTEPRWECLLSNLAAEIVFISSFTN